MKIFWISLAASIAVYFVVYAWERGTHRFSGLEDGLSSNTGAQTERLVFQPAWILERKTRSLVWRVRNRKPLLGHVYWDGTEE